MLNSFELIGRLVEDPTVRVLDDGIKVSNIRLAVNRPFKNSAGEFGTDYITVSLWYGTAQLTEQFCGKGDLIFVRGRIASKIQVINEKNYQFFEMIGERVVFLNTKGKQDLVMNDNKTVVETLEDE